MSKIISLANIKGGVGKSTIAINLAGYLATNATVLLIDADPQGTVTDWNMVRHRNSKIQNNNISILETIEPFNDENFVKSVEINSKGKEFVIIDCPPEAKKIIKPPVVGMVLFAYGSKMPLADKTSSITVLMKNIGHSGFRQFESVIAPGFERINHTTTLRIAAGHDACTRRSAHGRG
ncbi:MAG: ParA family protein [Rectinemataceae bacterium]|nr:ParA family protein [Rectinemataceae bacterium]